MSFVLEPNAEPLPGYRLIEPLGSGGFGTVWKCEAPGGLCKAMKFVVGNLNSLDPDGARAEQEYNALNRIKEVRHPFVLSLERIEIVGGELFIVMELADRSLHDKFVECQAAGLVGIPANQLIGHVRDAAEALDHMYERHRLLHLDIKPRNLFLVSDRVKVADFGMVKSAERQTGGMGGATPLYAAPETFKGNICQHSDQYSLAIVYQEMLTGQRPFTGKNPRQVALAHMTGEPELRALPEAERVVVARALAKDPDKRFPNCLAFVKALIHARAAARPSVLLDSPAAENGKRPKTMVETLEDILLDQEDDRGAPPPLLTEVPSDEVSQLGLTVHQPDTGVLRPTLIVGLGGFGRRALMELRCRFLDRFGDLGKIPMHSFLYIDPDPEAAKSAARGAPEVAYGSGEVYHLPLQPMANYRRRMFDHLKEWLPPEKLYAMPRSLQTQGCRALGRLAFADNHLRLQTRLRRKLEQVTHPDALYQSVTETGLALRDNRPRVYVIAAASGGSSGMLVDLGYSLRRLLAQLRHPDAEVTAFLFCGAPEDPATPRPEQANTYATLTELNHFASGDSQFAAQYAPDSPRVVEKGQPFHGIYLLKLTHRNPEALGDAVAHLGSYLFHELTTPLGLRLDRCRQPSWDSAATPFRSFGTYAVWFPRGLLLRRAAQQACIRLVQEWQGAGEPTAQAEVEAACARTLADPELRFEALCARIEEAASSASDGPLASSLTALLSQLEEQSQQFVAQDDPASWSLQASQRLQEWLGPGFESELETEWRKSYLGRALNAGIQKVAGEWNQRLVEAACRLMEHPGRRVAAAESVLFRFAQFCQESVETHRARLQTQKVKTQQAFEQMGRALEQCRTGAGGFSFFGSRSRRLLRVFVDHLAAFSRQQLAESVIEAGLQFFAVLQHHLDERIRDLSFCRQRLRHLQECLEAPAEDADEPAGHRVENDPTPFHSPLPSTEAYWDAIRHSATARLVLPDGEVDLDRAASRFLARLTPEQWMQLDQALQDKVLSGLGGLHQLCMTGSDLNRNLGTPLVALAADHLGAPEILPVTDVAEVEISAAAAQNATVASRVQNYCARAVPLVAAKNDAGQNVFLLVPASDSGKTFGEEAALEVKDLELVRVPGQADLMFCREQGYLSVEDLQRVFRPCRRAYDQAATAPSASPHARFDIIDWVPLDD